ncbi:MAG: RNA methyltransferase [Muribaculaceae bacterium]|nr:RNA methyltransferase [Muribaculaceae bacterium]
MESPSKSILKYVKSLADTKKRSIFGCFKAEGTKCVLDTLAHFETEIILATSAWYDDFGTSVPVGVKRYYCSGSDMERMTSLSTAPEVIAVYKIPQRQFDVCEAARNLVLALDTIQDPGNMGTIIRIADWFGVRHVICSKATVDSYNPKVIQATMGAISRVSVTYHNLPALLSELKDSGIEICGTFLHGENIYTASTKLPQNGVIVIGNEGRGISDEVSALVTRRLTIPPYPAGVQTSESLNAAIAAAVTLSTFRQKLY